MQTPSRPRLAWLATLGATAASTYALDAVATAGGLALVASGLLSGAGHTPLIAFLAITYAAWGAGLRVNLQANWRLLQRTGASTNILSKAAYSLARRRGARVQRFAAAAGYVLMELAKEAPYYAGAFGAAIATESVSGNHALAFLAGANLAAGAYELGLARATTALLRRKPYASFDGDWVPGEYLADYYGEVDADERETIAFFVDAMRHAPDGEPVLVMGTGPTLHHVFLAAPKASSLHLADYLPENLAEIERWHSRAAGAHDWRPFVRYTLECEGIVAPTDADVAEREELTRAAIRRLLVLDARRAMPVDRPYATVISAYCADSATADRGEWTTLMRNITALVRPGGLFLTAALRGCSHYVVGGKRFPSANVDERDLRGVLEPDFRADFEVRQVTGHDAQGYSAIVLGKAISQGRPWTADDVDQGQVAPAVEPVLAGASA
jgi:hypothetical protein